MKLDPKKPRVAEVISNDKSRVVVRTIRDDRIIDVTNFACPVYPVGTRGTVAYVSGASYGLYFFKPYKKQRAR